MAGKTLTQRLEALKQQQLNLEQQIKEIESKQQQKLKQERKERGHAIGMAMLRLIDEGVWSEEQVLELVDPFVINGKERRLLGLSPLQKKASGKAQKTQGQGKGKAKTITAKSEELSSTKEVRSETFPDTGSPEPVNTSVEASGKQTKTKGLPEPDAVDMAEFNV